MFSNILRPIFVLLIASFLTIGCSSNNVGADETDNGVTSVQASAEYSAPKTKGDPLEPFNRAVHSFNHYADILILKPVTQAYVYVLPVFVRNGIHNFLVNLNTPVVLANELLQWDWHGANVVTQRFVINSTVGLAGFIDVAKMHGIERLPSEDFGQTLGRWGIGSGPYLVLPIFGPSNPRDTIGLIVDMFLDPVNIWGWDQDEEEVLLARGILTAIDTRAGLLPNDDLINQSIDPYTTLKSAYIQNRAKLIQDGEDSYSGNYDAYSDEEYYY